MPILDALTQTRIFHLFYNDITREEAASNKRFVLKIPVTATHTFLEVLHVPSPVSALPMLGALARPRLVYAFLCDPEQPYDRAVYITTLFSGQDFPWMEPDPRGVSASISTSPVRCYPRGISIHESIPLLHVEVAVDPGWVDDFEAELADSGYLICKGKRYELPGQLLAAHQAQRGTSPT